MNVDFDTTKILRRWFEGRHVCHLCGARLSTLLPHKCRRAIVQFPLQAKLLADVWYPECPEIEIFDLSLRG